MQTIFPFIIIVIIIVINGIIRLVELLYIFRPNGGRNRKISS